MKIAVIAAVSTVLSASARAQPSPAPLKFEVASIRKAEPGPVGGQGPFLPGGRYSHRPSTLRTFILQALHVSSFQLIGGPDWLNKEYFVIDAKAADSSATETQMREMLLASIQERCGFKFHRESRETSVYVLTVNKVDKNSG